MVNSKIDPRQRLVRLIHVAKRDLKMDDDVYRAILLKIGKTESSSKMTVPELERTLEHMKRCGFKVRSKGKSGISSRPLASEAESRKIRALWLFLHELGIVKNPSEKALATYVKRMTKVDDLHWLNSDQTLVMIETLKKWAMRSLPSTVNTLMQEVREDIKSGKLHLSQQDAYVLNKVYQRALDFPSFDPMQDAWYALTNILEKGERHEFKQ